MPRCCVRSGILCFGSCDPGRVSRDAAPGALQAVLLVGRTCFDRLAFEGFARLEVAQSQLPRRLTFISMNRLATNSRLAQYLYDLISIMLRT